MAKPDKPDKPPRADDELIELARAILNTLKVIVDALGALQLPEQQLNKIMAKLSELAGLLTNVNDKLDKARAEIVAAIEALKQTDPDISPEGQTQLDRLTAVAQALDDIVPDAPTP